MERPTPHTLWWIPELTLRSIHIPAPMAQLPPAPHRSTVGPTPARRWQQHRTLSLQKKNTYITNRKKYLQQFPFVCSLNNGFLIATYADPLKIRTNLLLRHRHLLPHTPHCLQALCSTAAPVLTQPGMGVPKWWDSSWRSLKAPPDSWQSAVDVPNGAGGPEVSSYSSHPMVLPHVWWGTTLPITSLL